MKDKTQTKTHSGWNRLLLALLVVVLILASLLTVFRNNFSTGTKAYLFLKESQAIENITELTKVELRNNMPESIKSNFIKNALVNKVVDIVVTPENVSKIAETGLVNLYKLSDKAADIATKKIEFDTTIFKSQAEQYIPNLGLSESLTTTTLDFVKSVPNNVIIVNVEKQPNSPIATFLKIRNAYKGINMTTNILWLVVLLSLIGVIIINRKSLRKVLRSIYWSFGIAGAFVLLASYIVPPIANSFLPSTGNASESTAIGNLVDGIINNYFGLVRGFAWLYIIVAAIALLINFLIGSDKVKETYKSVSESISKKVKANK
ncbi:MAG: hypothetical protein NTY56_01140 [Patescibacteria group bacterium]|nr:hypothetical protein [Patescibacteria group bacterium]